MARAEETRCYDVISDNGVMRHGLVFLSYPEKVGDKPWCALSFNTSAESRFNFGVVGFYATSNEAFKAVMEAETVELRNA